MSLLTGWTEISLSAADGVTPAWTGNAFGANQPHARRMIDRLVFLSHPCAWELQFLQNTNRARTYRLADSTAVDLVRMERKVSSRWLEAIRQLGSNAFLIIDYFGGRPPDARLESGSVAPLLRAAREYLGDRYLVLFGTRPSNSEGVELRNRLLARGFTYDPATVSIESWDQSTEGCVANYGAHFAAGMGLRRGFPMHYELTFPDAPFAMTGRYLERFSLGNTDVSCYLSEDSEGHPFAIFFPGMLRDGESNRQVILTLKPGQVRFTDKMGNLVTLLSDNGSFRIPLYVDGYGKPVYAWGKKLATAEFRAALAAAVVASTVVSPPQEDRR